MPLLEAPASRASTADGQRAHAHRGQAARAFARRSRGRRKWRSRDSPRRQWPHPRRRRCCRRRHPTHRRRRSSRRTRWSRASRRRCRSSPTCCPMTMRPPKQRLPQTPQIRPRIRCASRVLKRLPCRRKPRRHPRSPIPASNSRQPTAAFHAGSATASEVPEPLRARVAADRLQAAQPSARHAATEAAVAAALEWLAADAKRGRPLGRRSARRRPRDPHARPRPPRRRCPGRHGRHRPGPARVSRQRRDAPRRQASRERAARPGVPARQPGRQRQPRRQRRVLRLDVLPRHRHARPQRGLCPDRRRATAAGPATRRCDTRSPPSTRAAAGAISRTTPAT